ncbi:hypothetical protein ACFSPU_06665 [Haoranjiania flava]|uniref:Type II toxin-antitoxin system HicB family antitoxin n=1 Tax=Haoranjiania flava TaxID=1856322 RepID=A0AAE3LQ40_9BACT|nr:hypothetical protein [Haoranjiania flava]MCU7694140.1 hypothetical protein [Haoranjiania flava]
MQLKINISLEPVFLHDKKTNGYTSYFRQYPNAVGDGDTKENSLDNLANVFLIMLANEPELVKEIIKDQPEIKLDKNQNFEIA